MKSTGIIRRVDELGRIVLPKEIRRTQGIPEGTPMEIYVDGNQVVLKKYIPESSFKGILDSFEAKLDDEYTELGIKENSMIRKHIKAIRTILQE